MRVFCGGFGFGFVAVFLVLVDPTASVCFSVFNLCWFVNCPSNNLSDAATEGDPDYTTLYANAVFLFNGSCSKLCLTGIHIQQTQIKQPLQTDTHSACLHFKHVQELLLFIHIHQPHQLRPFSSLACIYSQPTDTIIKETHCDFPYFSYFCFCGSLLRLFSL